MRNSRHILITAILAIYVAQLLGGRTLHNLESAAGCGHSHGHLAHSHQPALDTHHGHDHSHACDDLSKPESQVPGEQQAPSERHEHDSSNCWVCQVLAQAQEETLEVEVSGSTAVAEHRPVVTPVLVPTRPPSSILARGPPSLEA